MRSRKPRKAQQRLEKEFEGATAKLDRAKKQTADHEALLTAARLAHDEALRQHATRPKGASEIAYIAAARVIWPWSLASTKAYKAIIFGETAVIFAHAAAPFPASCISLCSRSRHPLSLLLLCLILQLHQLNHS